MENKRMSISQGDIDVVMDKLTRNGKYSAEILKLVEEDMKKGITRSEIDLYLARGNDIRIARIISDCLRNNYDSDVLNTVCAADFNFAQMQTAYAIYVDCKDLELTRRIISQMKAEPERMKMAYKKYKKNCEKKNKQVSTDGKTEAYDKPETDVKSKNANDNSDNPEKINSVLDNFQSAVDKIMAKLATDLDLFEKRLSDMEDMSDVRKRASATESEKEEKDTDDAIRQQLVDELDQKEQEIILKQDELTKAISQVKSLNRKNEEKDVEIKFLKETVDDLQKQTKSQEEALEAANVNINKLKETDNMKLSGEAAVDENNTSEEMEIKEASKVDNVISVQYTMPVSGITIDRTARKSNGLLALFSRLCFKRKSRADIVKLVSAGRLSVEQLSMIKTAIEKQLTEGQLIELINNNLEPLKMKEIIEIAVLENSLPD